MAAPYGIGADALLLLQSDRVFVFVWHRMKVFAVLSFKLSKLRDIEKK